MIAALWLEADEHIVLEKRDETGLLAGMWQLPAIEVEGPHGPGTLDAQLDGFLWSIAGEIEFAGRVAEAGVHGYVERVAERHGFTHLDWAVHVYQPIGVSLQPLFQRLSAGRDARYRVVPLTELRAYVFPRVYERIFETLSGERVR